MRRLIPLIATALIAVPSHAKPPHEDSPAPRELLESLGAGNSDEEIARAISAAEAHPLGTMQNPIRVAGPRGVQDYIARLRCSDGSKPKAGPDREGGVDAFGSVATIVPLSCGVAAAQSVAFDLYQEGHVETRPLPGFTIAR